jgi:hypothetical protein
MSITDLIAAMWVFPRHPNRQVIANPKARGDLTRRPLVWYVLELRDQTPGIVFPSTFIDNLSHGHSTSSLSLLGI